MEWVGTEGRTLRREVSPGKVLRGATGPPGEALVFGIGAHEDVLVFLEHAGR